ncbi:MAG TPA: aromatic ring-hydroxylating dioxygenase subunit alpha [Novosphingobium sp.]|nr:aromatic ring-hydroxylating dioxygenase subunit alpha [Novosphingobium sp.]HZV09476.1 aromatic ring-hydroxylating dioxygenase subunit alpha [Novosphingobium sp.]
MAEILTGAASGARDPVLWNDWHVIADLAALRAGADFATTLLDVPLLARLGAAGAQARRADGAPLHTEVAYGFLWACLGAPARPLITIAEYAEAGRTIATGGSVGVHVAAPRVVENFLDLGHLGYVHVGYLGEEPETMVHPYRVGPLEGGGVLATGCKVYQPVASPAAQGGYMVDYQYCVVRPLITCLHKANPVARDAWDVIYLFVQPVSEERSIAHTLMLFAPDGTQPADLRRFQQLIFLQDKPILENQTPRRLPLADGAELPIAADSTSVAYRRYLVAEGLAYGVIPAGARVAA